MTTNSKLSERKNDYCMEVPFRWLEASTVSQERFVIVDVGCIECGEQTEVVGIFDSEDEAQVAWEAVCAARGIEKREPRGGFLELLGLHDAEATSYLGGTGYFARGQHALEIHVYPPRGIVKTRATHDREES